MFVKETMLNTLQVFCKSQTIGKNLEKRQQAKKTINVQGGGVNKGDRPGGREQGGEGSVADQRVHHQTWKGSGCTAPGDCSREEI